MYINFIGDKREMIFFVPKYNFSQTMQPIIFDRVFTVVNGRKK
jgi:hypothetical protein